MASPKSVVITVCALVNLVVIIVGGWSLLSFKGQVYDYRQHISTTDEALFFQFGDGNLSADDERLLAHIRSRLTRPSPRRPRRLTNSGRKHFSQIGQSEWVDERLKQRRNGFFVECGAFDGETYSNSLFFELERNWTGLLVEANPNNYRTLLEKNRNAYVLGACLSPTRLPGQLKFQPAHELGGIVDKMLPGHMNRINSEKLGGTDVMVNCYPFNSIMDALGIRHVDYFSLDIEGPELAILETIDFDRLRIDVLTIEYPITGEGPATVEKLGNIRKLFERTKLYREVTIIRGSDVVFERI